MTGFIGVHIGAGTHSEKLQSQYEKICRLACKKGIEDLRNGKCSLDAVLSATIVLEDSPLTNAGIGSNLTWDGTVECDASVMDGDKLGFGAVGAVSKIKNPILVAHHLCLSQYKRLSLNRVPPCTLVGSGAERWAEENGLETVQPQSLITDRSLKTYKRYKKRAVSSDPDKEKPKEPVEDKLLDTVGAIAVDSEGKVAASCSSGGIVLKYPGRLGQAGTYGCGCWAQNYPTGRAAATSVTGCGEDLIKTCLAREAATSLIYSAHATVAINNSIRSFLDSPFLGKHSERLCGIIAIEVENYGRGEFTWGHTTASMAIGFMSTGDRLAQSRISRLPHGTKPGTTFIIEGKQVSLQSSRMSIQPKVEDDSDIEILEPDVLRGCYYEHQLNLVRALSNCGTNIPKKWEDFQAFVYKVLNLQLSTELIYSTWAELCAAEKNLKTELIEISDDEEPKVVSVISDQAGEVMQSNRASLSEQEAEVLRERLLLDKVIELELPHVLRQFFTPKKTKRSSLKRLGRKSNGRKSNDRSSSSSAYNSA